MKFLLMLGTIILIPIVGMFLRDWVHEGFHYAIRIAVRKVIAILVILAAMAIALYFISNK